MQKAAGMTLQNHLAAIAKATARKRKRRLSDLRFAKRTDNGYAFFITRIDHPWEILEEIAQSLVVAFPNLSYAQAVDTVSAWVNQQ